MVPFFICIFVVEKETNRIMTEYEVLRKATYLFLDKLGKKVDYETLLNKVWGTTCWRKNVKVYLITVWLNDVYYSAGYSLKRLEKMVLPKKYQEVKRTEGFDGDDCIHYKYSFKKIKRGPVHQSYVCCEGPVSEEDIIQHENLSKYPWYEVKIFTPQEWVEEMLSKEV